MRNGREPVLRAEAGPLKGGRPSLRVVVGSAALVAGFAIWLLAGRGLAAATPAKRPTGSARAAGAGPQVATLSLTGAPAISSQPVFLCVPSTAGASVTSDGDGTVGCDAGSTRVALPSRARDQRTLLSVLLHMRFDAAGVGGKPTIRFTGVNVQVVSGSGSTNGEGNLVVGYAENPGERPRTGSNDLIVGTDGGWSGYGQIVGGMGNTATGPYATAVGASNIASGIGSFAAGDANAAQGAESSVVGGESNTATGARSSVSGGEFNMATGAFSSASGGCDNLAGAGSLPTSTCSTSGVQSVTAGDHNQAVGAHAAVSGGTTNTAGGSFTSVSGGAATTRRVSTHR